MAHRGNRVDCPENTLASFRRAYEEGADIVETDLRLTADGHFVCIHDETVDRTTDGTGPVAGMTLADIRRLRATGGGPAHTGERVPTLAETAALVPPDRMLALELKSDRFLEPAVCRSLALEIERQRIRERTVFLSFRPERLAAARAAAPGIPVGWITLSRPWPRRDADLLGPWWPLILLNPLYVWIAHRRGQIVCPLDDAPDRRLSIYRILGCDVILTDDPGATRAAFARGRAGAGTRRH